MPQSISCHKTIRRLDISRMIHCLSFWLHIYVLRSSRFCRFWVLCVSLVTTSQFYLLLAWLLKHLLINQYHQCLTVDHVPNDLQSGQCGLVITRRVHCYLYCILYILYVYMMYIIYIYIYIYIYIFVYSYVCVHMCFADVLMKNELNLTMIQLFGSIISNLPCFYLNSILMFLSNWIQPLWTKVSWVQEKATTKYL